MVTIEVTADEAKRQVNRWLLHEVNMQMGAEQPILVVGERTVWRVPVYWSAPHVGHVGIAGNIEVDVLSGNMDRSEQRKAELTQRAQELAAELPPYRPREAPAAYLARHVAPTHKPGRPPGDPRDLLSTLS